MALKEKLKTFPYGLYVLRGIAIFAFLMVIKTLLTVSALMTYTNASGNFQGTPEWAVYIIVAVGDLFIYNSLVYIFSYNDRKVLAEFISQNKPKVKFFEEMREIIKSKEFLTETLTILALSFFATILGGFYEFQKMFADTGAPAVLLSVIPHLFVYPLIFCVSAYARYEVRRRWHWLDYTGRLEQVFSIPRLIFSAILIFFGYSFLFAYSPIILLPFLLIFGLVSALFISADLKTALITIAIIIFIIALILVFIAMNAIRIRKKLIKKLKKVAMESGYELSPISRPYASLFRAIRECNFTLKLGEKVFSCRLIGSWWQRAPLYFISDKHAYYLHRFGSREHHFDFLGEFCYDFNGEGEKIVILNPVPKKAFVTKGSLYVEVPWYDSDKKLSVVRGSEYTRANRLKKKVDDDVKRIEPGDKIWNYTIYNTTSFIGAVDRKCLGRSNGMFE